MHAFSFGSKADFVWQLYASVQRTPGELIGLPEYPAVGLVQCSLQMLRCVSAQQQRNLKKAQKRKVQCFRFQFWGIGRDLYVTAGQQRYDCFVECSKQLQFVLVAVSSHRTCMCAGVSVQGRGRVGLCGVQ